MLIGFDIDGVLFPWEDAVAQALRERFGIEPLGTMTSWDDYQARTTREQWAWLWTHEGTRATLGQTWRIYPGVAEAVRAIVEAGHDVHFVTHRDPCTAGVVTAEFLAMHFCCYRGLHVITSSTPKRKLAWWDVFVDDKPETVFDFIDNTGAVVFAPRRPWNVEELEGFDTDMGWGAKIYDDPADIVRWVEARS